MLVFLTALTVFAAIVTINTIVSTRRNKFHDFWYGLFCSTRVTRTRERLLSSEYETIKNPKFVFYPEYRPIGESSYRGFILKSNKKEEVHFDTEVEATHFLKETFNWWIGEYKASQNRFGFSVFAFLFINLCALYLYSTFGLIK